MLMSVIYRPHRGGLREAMEEVNRFSNIDEMLSHIVKKHNEYSVKQITKEDIFFQLYDKDPDNRIGWNNTYIILIGSYPHGFFTDDYDENWEEIYDNFLTTSH